MNLGKIGDQYVEFLKGHLLSFWHKKIGPAVKKLWSLKDRKGENILSQIKSGMLSLQSASRGSTNHFPGKWRL